VRIVFDFHLLTQPESERNVTRRIMRHCIRQFTQRDQPALSSRRVAASFNKALPATAAVLGSSEAGEKHNAVVAGASAPPAAVAALGR
jgi:hypothetical protein